MTGDRTVELMNLVVDGEATPVEEGELRKLLAESSEARAVFEELEQLARSLEEASAADPWPHLSESVIAELKRRADNVVPLRASDGLADARSDHPKSPSRVRRRWLTAVWAAAALALASLTVIPLMTSRMGEVETSSAAGSIRPVDMRSWPEVGRFEAAGSEAALEVRAEGRRVAILPRLAEQGDRPITLRWDTGRLRLLEFSPEVRKNAAHNNNGEVTFSGRDLSPLLVLEKRDGGVRGDIPVVLSIGGRDVVTAWIPQD